jgi:hypothetical protein
MKSAAAVALLLVAAAGNTLSADVAPSPSPSPRPAAKKPRATASPKPPPTYTDEDLKKATGHVESATAAGTPSPTPGASNRAGEDEVVANDWRMRVAAKRVALGQAQERAKNAQARIDELKLDQGGNDLQDPNREQNRQAKIAKAMEDLAQAQKDIEAARQALSDFEEDARRKGIPPGWLREP